MKMVTKVHRAILITLLAFVMTSGSFYVSKAETSEAPLWRGHPSAIWHEEHVEPTCTTDGYHREGIWCRACKKYKSDTFKEEIYPSFGGHTHSAPVEENRVDATCLQGGSYEEVVYCSVCEEELSRESHVIEAKGHVHSDPVEENRVEATCLQNGSYDEVVYCSVCEEELSRESHVIEAKGHVHNDPVEEKRVEATCTQDGSYDEVVYCAVCEEELSRKVFILPHGHEPGDEWEVAEEATTEKEGLEVLKCKKCEEVIGSKPIAKIELPPEPEKEIEVIPTYVTVEGPEGSKNARVDEEGNATIKDFFMELEKGSGAEETFKMQVKDNTYTVTRYADGESSGQLPPGFKISGRDLVISGVSGDLDIRVLEHTALGGGVYYDPGTDDETSVGGGGYTSPDGSYYEPAVGSVSEDRVVTRNTNNNNNTRNNANAADSISSYAESLLEGLTESASAADEATADETPSASSFFKADPSESSAADNTVSNVGASPSALLIAVDIALISALILGIGVLWKLGILNLKR